jgi:uncharacterized membrane protein
MWANMLLLFCLSLIPVSAEWMRSAAGLHLDPRGPAAFFGIVGLAAALSYTWLVRALIRANGRDSGLARAIHTDIKGNVSLGLYAAGVALAGFRAYLSYICYAAVSVIWLIPDRRLTHTHADESDHQP